MTESERIDYLIKSLEGDNARRFSDATGIPTPRISKMRNGEQRIWAYIDKICTAYPQVNREWLVNGTGKSGLESTQKTPAEYEEEIRRLKDLVRTLKKELKLNQKVISQFFKQ